ncbi:MAG: isoprenylcysteine carboxylmethyltransferase family protein [Planctomycetes bacterium]|nr:isoprenylcysteine carboxylmethyltransferase family protein [Planctomycetota bacterium]
METSEKNVPVGTLPRAILQLARFSLFLAITLFLPGGIAWRAGWLFFAVLITLTVLSSMYLWRVNPDIFVARNKIHKGTKRWDKVILVLFSGSFLGVFVVAGLDARCGWSSIPLWLMGLGYLPITLGMVASDWACAVNQFAERSVRIQSDRGHKVIDAGPYAIVRHPLYLACIFLLGGAPLSLRSYWAFIPVAAGIVVLVVRTVLEDRTLQDELDGYKDYASRVRYRLIPGIW